MSAATSTTQRPTAAQLRVILANDGHLLVGAGAGSGKTSTVVQKLCYLMGAPVTDESGEEHRYSSPLGLHEIAAITYTNQAAADLKRKLRAGLVAAGMREQASDVEAARIGTIHGFCGDILRDFSLRAGLPPAQRVLDDGESSTVAADAARAVLHEAAERGVPGLEELMMERKMGDVLACITRLASDSTQLAVWQTNRADLRDHERTLLDLARSALVTREEQLVRLGALDFDRMIVATRDLLLQNDSVRHAVQRSIRLLVVDEFQDVDPAQRDIAMSLGGISNGDPRACRLMLVGDPKQSIYRFRRADVSLWNGVQQQFADGRAGTHLQLTDNFRSKQGILALVDDLVGPHFDRPVHEDGTRQPFEVGYAPLDARWKDAAGDECVELLLVPAADDGKTRKVGDVRALEAAAVAARVARLVAEGRASYGDVAILLGGWGAVEVYESALRKAGIPTYALRAEGFQETREIIDCTLALRAIRDTRDDVAMAGFLKGPFVGVRDSTLLALAEARHPGGIAGAMGGEAREAELLARAGELLTRFGALRDRIPVHELLSRLVAESGFLVALSLDERRGMQAIANVRKLVRIAENAPEQSLGEFLRAIADTRLREDRIGEERLYGERSNVVTITSVHSAKGLEWPVVFWCDLVRVPPADNDALLCGRDLFRLKAAKDLDEDGKEIPDDEHEAIKMELGLERLAESYRMWYVASTRPQRLLVLSGVPLGTVKTEAASVAGHIRTRFANELLGDALPERIPYRHSSGVGYQIVVRLASTTLPTTEAAVRDSQVALTLPPTPVLAPTGRSRLSATQLMTFQRDPGRWWKHYAFGFDAGRTATTAGSARGTGDAGASARSGSVVHAILERYNYDLHDIEELIEGAIAEHDTDAPELSTSEGLSYRARIRELVDRAAAHPSWKAAALSPSARRELTFTRVLPGGGTIEGSFDLAAMTEHGVEILDAKTGTVHDTSVLAERYAVQGATYTEAAGAITGGPATFTLLLAETGESVAVPTSADVSSLTIAGALRGFHPVGHDMA
ncbi:MAG: UvrD-helicase domain-containing protein [Gemmatimonadota bacterium]